MKYLITIIVVMTIGLVAKAETVECRAFNRNGKIQVCSTEKRAHVSPDWSNTRMHRQGLPAINTSTRRSR